MPRLRPIRRRTERPPAPWRRSHNPRREERWRGQDRSRHDRGLRVPRTRRRRHRGGRVAGFPYQLAAGRRRIRPRRRVGVSFLVGNPEEVLAHSWPLALDPLSGHPAHRKHLDDPGARATLKQLGVTDGTRTRALRSHNPPTPVSTCCWMFRTEETHAGKAPGFKLLSVVSEWYQ